VSFNPDYNPFKSASIKSENPIETSNKKNWETLYEGFKQTGYNELTDQPLEHPVEEQRQLQNETIDYKTMQVMGKYIVTSFEENVWLIDQQRAHERIMYEHFFNTKEQRPNSTQQLLFPGHIELSTNDFVLIQNLIDEFRLLGFDMEVFGKNNIVVNGTPAELGEFNVQQMIEGVLENYKLNTLDKKLDIHDNLCRALAKNTCIKYGKFLDEKEMQLIISHLMQCDNPLYSPNGKPVMMEIGKDEIEKFFKR
jgi:DNA mismatch repair protein MutL